jgi:hypothetical protein
MFHVLMAYVSIVHVPMFHVSMVHISMVCSSLFWLSTGAAGTALRVQGNARCSTHLNMIAATESINRQTLKGLFDRAIQCVRRDRGAPAFWWSMIF